MLSITGKLIKIYKPVPTNIGFYCSDVHRFVLKVDDHFIGDKGLFNLYQPSVFEEIMFHYENFEPNEECIMNNFEVGNRVEVHFSIGNFHRKKQPARKDKSAFILWVHKVRKI